MSDGKKIFGEDKPINAAEAARRKSKWRRLTASQWARAEAMWKTGNYTMDVIAAEFNVSVTALKHRFKKHNVRKGEDADRQSRAIAAQMESRQIAESEEAFKQIQKFKSDNLKYVEAVQRRAMTIFAKDIQEGKRHAASGSDFKALSDLMRLLKTGWEIGADVLHLDKEEMNDDSLPTLEITKLTDDDVEELRQTQLIEERELMGLGIDPENPDESIVDEEGIDEMIEDAPEEEDQTVVEEGDASPPA